MVAGSVSAVRNEAKHGPIGEKSQGGGFLHRLGSAVHDASKGLDMSEREVTKTFGNAALLQRLKQNSELVAAEQELHWFVDSMVFRGFITLAVLLSCLQIGAEVDSPDLEIWHWAEHAFTSLFTFEAAAKILVSGRMYFQCPWNSMDFGLVCLAIFDTWILGVIGAGTDWDLQQLSVMRVFRLTRLVRVLRLVKRFRKFVLIISGVVDALKCTLWVSAVLCLAIYVGSIFLMGFIGGRHGTMYPGFIADTEAIDMQEIMLNFNPHIYFGSLASAMLTLFNVAIMAEWAEIVWPVFLKQPWLLVFFIGFSMFVTFGVMNVIIGMIVDNVMENARQIAQEEQDRNLKHKLGILRHVQDLWMTIDSDQNGFVTLEELRDAMGQDHLQHAQLNALLNQVALPRGFEAADLFLMLDDSGDQKLSHDEFIESFYRICDCSPFQQVCLVQKGVNHVKAMVRETMLLVESRCDRMEEMLQRLTSEKEESDGREEKCQSSMAPMCEQTSMACTAADSLAVLESLKEQLHEGSLRLEFDTGASEASDRRPALKLTKAEPYDIRRPAKAERSLSGSPPPQVTAELIMPMQVKLSTSELASTVELASTAELASTRLNL